MSTIYYSPCPCKNIDITTLPVQPDYHVLRCLAKCFTFTRSTSCLRYLCFKCRIKHFWWNVTSRVHYSIENGKIISFVIKLKINFLYIVWFPNHEMIPQNNLYSLFWAQAQDGKTLYNFFQILSHLIVCNVIYKAKKIAKVIYNWKKN